MSKLALIVAFDFPPSSSAAVQRTLKMVDYLKDFGWNCVILTAKQSAYERIETSQAIPLHVQEHVYRSSALDVHRHLSIKGKHFNWMKCIDRWSTWIPGAIILGKKLLKKYKFDAIVSTVPIPSSHIVAGYLAKKSGLPWMADYQDPMSYHYEPTPWLRRKCHQYIDKMVATKANAVVFATKQAMQSYKNSFPTIPETKFYFVENGFDESNFQYVMKNSGNYTSPFSANKFSFYYSGVLYANGRDPVPFFKSIAKFINQCPSKKNGIEIIFQGAGSGEQFHEVINELGITTIVKFYPSVSYSESIHNMLNADALVLIQDEIFNLQVPGKFYEYIRSRKPILAITPPYSATADVGKRLFNCFIGFNESDILRNVSLIIDSGKDSLDYKTTSVQHEDVDSFSRYNKSKELSKILENIAQLKKLDVHKTTD